jgi:NAD(P)-dependent dehydrogenase (short-subunit alcohol dehydrogenase family)
MAIDLRGRAIAITGASSGIGAATAIACARAGMPVALGARRLDKLHALVERIRGAGGAAIAVQVDVTDDGQCEAFVRRAAAELGGGSLYGVFANAGYGQEAAVDAMSDADVRAMFETNLFGSLRVIRPALPLMQARPGDRAPAGHVLWCSSCLALLPTPFNGVYSATKAAQHHLGRAMRTELRPRRIEVSTVHPIGTRTAFFELAIERSADPRLLSRDNSPLMQDASVVAGKVLACLRRPRAEVWTGPAAFLLRTAMVGASWLPNLADPLIARLVLSRKARAARQVPSR